MKPALLTLCVLILASCTEDEKACRDKLVADFEASSAFGKQQAKALPLFSQEAEDWREYSCLLYTSPSPRD